MMKLKHVAFAGFTALAFSQFAIAGGSAKQQSGMQGEASASQEQSKSAASGVDQSTIRQAQEKLAGKGHEVQADGKLGPKTQAAVKEFQQSEGLKTSGKLDQQTLAALGVNEGSAGAGSTSSPSSSSSGSSSSSPSASDSSSSGSSSAGSSSSSPSSSDPAAAPSSQPQASPAPKAETPQSK
jgi:peptidoglycan hydrolase-like protein with peptidoglycan-binding domain